MEDSSKDLESASPRDSTAPNAAPTVSTPSPHISRLSTSNPPPFTDWTDQLNTCDTIEVLEIHEGSSEWLSVPVDEIGDPFQLSEQISVRLFLVEGLAPKTIKFFSQIDEDFFFYHSRNTLPFDGLGLDHDCFFAKWSRRVFQNRLQWQIDDRIAKGRPFNLDVPLDPEKVGLDHDRYQRADGISRPYSSLEANVKSDEPFLRHAVEECTSTCFMKVGDGLVGVLVFDAPRQVLVTSAHYRGQRKETGEVSLQDSFSNFTTSRRRVKEQLQVPANVEVARSCPERSVKNIILRLIFEDRKEVVSHIREALDFIDEYMSDDTVLRSCLQDWRCLFGQWKKILANDLINIAYITQNLAGEETTAPVTNRKRDSTGILCPPTQAEFDRLTKEVQGLIERAASTFQSIMSTMSIIESAKAIAQAEEISKLTKLAFFFIPLTLCASVFGMNITGWQDRLQTWIWIVVSLTVTSSTYMALYSREIRIALSRSPAHLQALTVNDTARKISRSNLIFLYYCRRTGRGILLALKYLLTRDGLLLLSILLFLTGWALGIWAIATMISLARGIRVATAVVFAICSLAVFVIWFIILNDPDARDSMGRIKLALCACLCACIAVGVWALLTYAPIPYGEKVSIAVGMGVGIPCLFSLWLAITMGMGERWSRTYIIGLLIFHAILFGALAPSLWAILTKSSLNQDVGVGLSVGLGVGLPCLVPLLIYPLTVLLSVWDPDSWD